jgi:hypothetical protein
MGQHAQALAFEPAERRATVRSRVSCPAQLQLPTGQRLGCLWDLSERGARIQMDNPPRAGTTVLLEWMCYDAICKVAWATEDMCGLMFEKQIPLARVVEAQQHREEFSGPVAELGNIALGRKRGALR